MLATQLSHKFQHQSRYTDVVDSEQALWQYFCDVSEAVDDANERGKGQPYASGQFMIVAQAGDIELTVNNVTEEDAILIAAELRTGGVNVSVRDTVICPTCQQRVAKQSYCTSCRSKLPS
ncbi:MAG: hypothetical protein AAF267_12080 [Deinococcota bacterium]